jgi:protein O-GlcNAc transferase
MKSSKGFGKPRQEAESLNLSAPLQLALAQVATHRRAGRLIEAQSILEQILQVEPDCAPVLFELGSVCYQQGKFQEAIQWLDRAIQQDPRQAQTYVLLGSCLGSLGMGEAAIQQFQQALAIDLHCLEAHFNLGMTLFNLGRTAEAESSFRSVVATQPQFAEGHNALGLVFLNTGRHAEAQTSFQQAAMLVPSNPQFHHNLGTVLDAAFKFEEAADSYRCAMEANPAHLQTYLPLANVLQQLNRTEEAVDWLQRASALAPEYTSTLWAASLALPVLYTTPTQIRIWRERFTHQLSELCQRVALNTPQQQMQAVEATSRWTTFYLPYQGLNDVDLQRQYGTLVHQIMAAAYPEWTKATTPWRQGEKIRVGYLSAHIRRHNGAQWALGWLRHHDRDQFEVYVYHTGLVCDAVTDEFRAHCDVFYHLPGDLPTVGAQLAADQLHVLVFTDIGMDPRMSRLAALRFAPVQCTAWGHPVTSGFPTIDAYLSSDLMEPENAQEHYTEHLVRLPNLGLCLQRPQFPSSLKTRDEFGLNSNCVLYFCCQSLYKYLPQYDRVFALIALQVPSAQFVFLSHWSEAITAQFRKRLRRAFRLYGLSSEQYCIVLPRQNPEDYLNLHCLADIYLDTFCWSGGNTTLEALACDLPVVTCPGELMRGRHSLAMLRRLGISETVAINEADYVRIAVQLGRDPVWRRQLAETIHERKALLFEDRDCLVGLETFYRQAVAGADSSGESLGTAESVSLFSESVSLFSEGATQPIDIAAQFDLAMSYLQQEQWIQSEAAFQQIVQYAPSLGAAHAGLGSALAGQNKLEEAVFSLRRAIELQPGEAELQYNLGLVLLGLGQRQSDLSRIQEAEVYLQEAVVLQPDYTEARYSLGVTLVELAFRQSEPTRLARAESQFRRALALQPFLAEACSNLGCTLTEQERFSEALNCFDHALRLQPNLLHAHTNRSYLYLLLGQLSKAWSGQASLRAEEQMRGVSRFNQPHWDGLALHGKTVLVHPTFGGDCGLGDAIQYIRYAAVLREQGATVIVECRMVEHRLFQSCPDVDLLVCRGEPLPAFTVQAPLLALPALCGTILETIPATVPYLSAPQSCNLSESLQQALLEAKGLKVGLVWSPSLAKAVDYKRYCPLPMLAELLELPNLSWFSLYQGSQQDDLDPYREQIVDLGTHFQDLADTAWAIKHLDLVITVDTAVAHLAGAMGKSVWVLLPRVPDGCWLLERGDSPWYPSMLLFRQPTLGEWPAAVAEVRSALQAWLEAEGVGSRSPEK